MRLLFQSGTARNVRGIPADQDADVVFLLRDLALQIRNGGRRVEDQLFRLPHVNERGGAAARRDLGSAPWTISATGSSGSQGEIGAFRPNFAHRSFRTLLFALVTSPTLTFSEMSIGSRSL